MKTEYLFSKLFFAAANNVTSSAPGDYLLLVEWEPPTQLYPGGTIPLDPAYAM